MSKLTYKQDSSGIYKNPENVEDIKKSILETKTHGEIKNLIDRVFPTWIIGMMEGYSSDYPWLQKNWEVLCEQKIKTDPKAIVVVDYINHTEQEFSLLNLFCELLTTAGYTVRRKEELISCVTCGKAIPVIELWRMFKSKGMPVPSGWSKKCSGC